MIDHQSLSDVLRGRRTPIETADWLRGTYFPELIRRFNSEDVRKRLGLYKGERIPDNERNLTDVRNRVSIVIEYEVARLSNDLLEEARVADLFWSYVVANRFPDLEVRQGDGQRFLRFEIKCLQSIAEEKSANFDTLLKDINPGTDYVVVFLWEWDALTQGAVKWDRAPKIIAGYVLHADSLARLRDCYWLSNPPSDLGGGYQGFDVRYAVNCKNGVYAEEEGNYGKLLRIWQKDLAERPAGGRELSDTEAEYFRFRDDVIKAGFWSLCNLHLPNLSSVKTVERIDLAGEEVGAWSGDFAFVLSSLVPKTFVRSGGRALGVRYVVTLTERYRCAGYEYDNGVAKEKFRDIKPKRLNRILFGLD